MESEETIKEKLRQFAADKAIKDILGKLDVILGEINSINYQLREGKSCSNRKV
jgi:hypothetical protein